EQLAALRCIPNLDVWRPADATETAASWAAAVERKEGPTALAFTRQKLPVLQRSRPANVREALRGAYALVDVEDPDLVIVATGSEVSTSQQALADAYDLTPHKVAGRISKWLEGGGRTNTK